MLQAMKAKQVIIQADIVLDLSNVDLPIKLAEVENQVYQLEFEISEDIKVQMSEQEKNEHRLEVKTYTDRVNKLKLIESRSTP